MNRKNFVSRIKRKGGERKYELLKGTWWMTLLFCEGVPELGFAIVLELHHPAIRTTVCLQSQKCWFVEEIKKCPGHLSITQYLASADVAISASIHVADKD